MARIDSPPASDHFEIVCCRFVFDYTLPGDVIDPFRGVLDYIPPLYQNSSSDSALRAAFAATSYINFFRRCSDVRKEDKATASKYYAQALLRVQDELRDKEKARSDGLLVAVYLMGIYEVSLSCQLTISRFVSDSDFILTQKCRLCWQVPQESLSRLTLKVLRRF